MQAGNRRAKRRTWGLALTGALLATTALTGIPATAQATAQDAAFEGQVGTFNMAGGHDEFGKLGNEAPDALVRSVNTHKPLVMTLQEACSDWSTRLDAQLPDYEVLFNRTKNAKGAVNPCKHKGAEFGLAVLYRTGMGFEAEYRGQNEEWDEDGPNYPTGQGRSLHSLPGQERRELLCVIAKERELLACSTHLSARDEGEASRRVESLNARSWLAGAYPGYTTFLGGDLNSTPEGRAPGNFYHWRYGFGAIGQFKELTSVCGDVMQEYAPTPPVRKCRSGEDTHNSGDKLDFLFASPSVTVRENAVNDATYSDHRLVFSTVAF